MKTQNAHLLKWRYWFILLSLLAFVTPTKTPSLAQEGNTPVAPAQVLTQLQIVPPARGAALLAKAQAGGQVKVIVDLNVQFVPEGRLVNPAVETVASSQAVQSQRSQLAQAKMSVTSLLVPHNARVTASWDGLPGIAVTTDANGLQALLNSPLVRQVYEDVAVPPTLGYSLPLINASSAGGAWGQGVDGTGFTVAVLDTGAFSGHEFLSGQVVTEACFSSNSPGNSSLCPGGAASATGSGAANPFARCVTLAGGPASCEHGTHVSGIVAGKWGYYTSPTLIQPIDMGGVARGANIIPIQVFTYIADCNSGIPGNQPCVASYTSDQINAINHVYNTLASVGPGAGPYNIASINMSLGGGQYAGNNCDAINPIEQSALANLRAVGIAPVISSGNDGFVNAMSNPGCLSAAVSVGATEINHLAGPGRGFVTPNWPTNAWCQSKYGFTCYGSGVERIAYFSNSSPALELLAPGYYIESSVIGSDASIMDKYKLLSGTSMAAPHVAGAWAILKQQSPAATVNRILETLQNTGVTFADNAYTGNSIAFPPAQVTYRSGALGTSFSRIDVGAAVLELGRDFGDAPTTYSTLNTSDGARHIRVQEYYLGAAADSENDGTPATDDGDDGVTFPEMMVGSTVSVSVTASVVQSASVPASYLGKLYAWIDFNRDGDFADTGEQAIHGVPLTGPYPQLLPITIPADATAGVTWARFRYSTQSGLSFIGQAYNGEVEDYTITLASSPMNASPVRNVYRTARPTLTWNAVTLATGYMLQVDSQITFTTPLDYHNDNIPAGTLNITTDQLEDGQYYWRVCAKQANGTCIWSAIDSFVVDAP